MTPLRIAVVVHGRFHAFDLARELIARGHDVTVFTNYPAWAVRRSGIDPSRVRSAWTHGAVTRAIPHLPEVVRGARAEIWLHESFGRWAAVELAGEVWDVIHCWSGVSEELLRSASVQAGCRLLMRGSAHIVEQDRLLAEEEARIGARIDRPSAWMIEREQREYALADAVVVLSEFARASFLAAHHPAGRLHLLPLGVDVEAFRPSPATVASRSRRLRGGEPLRVLYVGTLSARKGMRDLVAIARELAGEALEFTLVGPMMPEARSILAAAGANVRVPGKVAQRDLPAVYADADLFVFPSIEDGFGMVLTQAKAAGLPVLCTTNCAGPDLISDGIDGWVLPVRRPDMFVERLRRCHQRREALAVMAESIASSWEPRDWADVAVGFERVAHESLSGRAVKEHHA